MRVSGTVVPDPETVIEDGAVVTSGDEIVFVGTNNEAADRYPDHDHRAFDIVAPGFVGAHVHTVQSLGRGMADDTALLEWLFDHVLPMEAAMDRRDVEIATMLGYLECLESGTTTVIDHLTVNHADAAFEAAGEIGIRGCLGKVMMDKASPPGLEEDTDAALATSERLLETYHGAYDDRIRYVLTPRFAVTCTEACLRGTRELADTHDVRIHTHASENRDEIATIEDEHDMSNVRWLDEVGLTGEDVILAHCVWTDDAERELLAETGTNVVHCPSANMKLASGIAPIRDYLERGVTVALGNDGPPCNNTLDILTEMRQASLLAKVDHLDPTVLSASTVLEMATRSGAEVAGFETVGKLEAGWKADLIGIETDSSRATPVADPHSHLVYTAHGDDVEFTMIDGQVVYDGEIVTVDADAIREEAERRAAALRD